jgi:hypothetical protein
MLYQKTIVFLFLAIFCSLISCEKKQNNNPEEVLTMKMPSLDYNTSKKSIFNVDSSLIQQKLENYNNKDKIENNVNLNSNSKPEVLKKLLRKNKLNYQIEKISSSVCDLNYDGKNDIIIFYKIYNSKDTSLSMNLFINKNNVLVNVLEQPLPETATTIKDILFYKDSTFEVRYYTFDSKLEKLIFKFENEFNFKKIN